MAEEIKLTPRQSAFVEHYLKHNNASKAAREAGYAEVGSSVRGCELLANRKVRQVLAAAREERGRRLGITADEVLRHIADKAFSGVADMVATTNLKMLGDHLGLFDGRRKADLGHTPDDSAGVFDFDEKVEK